SKGSARCRGCMGCLPREEAEEASDRGRRVLMLLLVASVLVLMAAWNGRYYGWLQSRLRVIRRAGACRANQNREVSQEGRRVGAAGGGTCGCHGAAGRRTL